MTITTSLCLTCLGLAIEAAVGYPMRLFERIGHPATWIGALIAATEARLNLASASASASRRRLLGIASLVFWLVFVGGVTALLTWVCAGSLIGFVLLSLIASTLLAQRSLFEHVDYVAKALETQGLEAGRLAVARIVGRDVAALDVCGVARAAIESLAENFSDGVVAPALWLAVGGVPACALYKTINTADSMVGHRTPRFKAYGRAAARLDDLVNLPASRLAAFWLVLAAAMHGPARARAAFGVIRRDAKRHRSPNAGWPEAAMAGALDLRLSGPRIYAGREVKEPFLGDGSVDADASDIRRALSLYLRACTIQFVAFAILAGLALWFSARG